MSATPRVLLLTSTSHPPDGCVATTRSQDAEGVVADAPKALVALRAERGRACEVGALPVFLTASTADFRDAGFGSFKTIRGGLAGAALAYRERVEASRSRLTIVLAAVAFVVMMLLAFATYLFFTTQPDDAAAKAREAAAYDGYRRRFGWSQPGPLECRTETEFAALDAALAGPLAPPAEFAEKWRDTPAITLHRKWLADAALAKRHRQAMAAWHRDRSRRGSELLDEPRPALAAAVAILQEQPPLPRTGIVPESVRLPQRRGNPLTYESIHASDLVEQAASEWDATAWRLTGVPAVHALARQLGFWPRWH